MCAIMLSIILPVFCILSGISGSQVPVQPYDLFDTAELLYQDLSNAVELKLNESLPELHLLVLQLHALASSTAVNGAIQVRDDVNKILEQVDGIRRDARHSGLDEEKVESCIQSVQYEINVLPKIVNTEIQECLNTSVDAGVALLDKSINDILKVRNVVEGLHLKIDECKLASDTTQCVLKVIEELSIAMYNLPTKIEEETKQVKVVMESLESLFPSCVEDRIDIVDNVGNDIISHIRSCCGLPPI